MIHLDVFFAHNKEILLFIYGLGFFILGFAIILQVQQSSLWIPGALLAGWMFIVFFILLPVQPNLQIWYRTANALARYFIGFPGGLLAAYGLRLHAIKRIKPLNVPVIFSTLRIAGVSLGIYAILGGLIPRPVNFFPGDILNTQTFEQAVGIPITLFRTLISVIIAASVIRSLEIFGLETQRKIEELEQSQIINTEHERLARELHDGAIQKVYTAGLLVESAARLTEPKSELAKRLERSVVVLNDAIADLRHNLAELHHSQDFTSETSLVQLLRQLADEPHYNTLVNISLDLKVPEDKSLSPLRSGHIMAIVNEAL